MLSQTRRFLGPLWPPGAPGLGSRHPCVSAPRSLIGGVGKSLLSHSPRHVPAFRGGDHSLSGALIPTEGGAGEHPLAVRAARAGRGQYGLRGPSAQRLPAHSPGWGGISMGLMVIYNGKPPLSPRIVLPDRGKKETVNRLSSQVMMKPAARPRPQCPRPRQSALLSSVTFFSKNLQPRTRPAPYP